nr:hypothetical protein [uncultured Acetatifactor sp.]
MAKYFDVTGVCRPSEHCMERREWCMDYRSGKWAKEILDSRNEEGMWGNFHTLAQPVRNKAITTEQAIRRLRILGFTKEDEAVQAVLERMCLCVSGEKKIDDYYEKKHDWPLFEKLMLSAWIRLFEPENEIALNVARQWAYIAERAFRSGRYDREDDMEAFGQQFGRKPKSSFETGFGMFYHVVLLQGVLTTETENRLLDYYISRPDGIYYVYDKALSILPEEFASKKTSYYLAAIEALSGYPQARGNLGFVAEWIDSNKDRSGRWDLGPGAKDGVYFPLSDSWRKPECRIADCTERINGILQKIS